MYENSTKLSTNETPHTAPEATHSLRIGARTLVAVRRQSNHDFVGQRHRSLTGKTIDCTEMLMTPVTHFEATIPPASWRWFARRVVTQKSNEALAGATRTSLHASPRYCL
jgi:hypothetical protein